MAIGISSDYVKKYTNIPTQASIKRMIKLSPFTVRYRAFMRWFLKNKKQTSSQECHIASNLEKRALHFQKNGWAFIENFLSKDFHEELVKNWPKKYYMTPPKKLTKSYDVGFEWARGNKSDSEYLDQHPTAQKLLDYLRSEKFSDRMTNFVGKNKTFVCYSFIMHTAYTGSQVVPHKDGIYNDQRAKNFLNILLFINGSGGNSSGGLTLSRDNGLHDIIFEPTNLFNTALIYDSKADFYHGFKPLDMGKFRWAVGAQFCEKEYLEG